MKKSWIRAAIFGCFMIEGLAGCSSVKDGPDGGHTVSWYLHHQSKMREERQWCANSVDRSKLTSCQNAGKAGAKALGYNAKKAMQSLGNDLP
ncbi:EexN family lipoprotein [Acidithiobacillus sp. IBUN Pt1247-S3]|uniref:EexN family lipoprotein n=1 Tax=Acidithiobacillus sp. IBUN Pt1247-S3 TaxID=3166642 RepID=UPI0034E424A7